MKQVKKKSVIPPYAVAALWIVRAFSGRLSSFGDIIGCAALSIVLMLLVFVCTGIMNRFGGDEEEGGVMV